MKKLLITLGLSVIGFIGFSSADTITFTPNDDCIGSESCNYNPYTIKVNENLSKEQFNENNITNFNCIGDCFIIFLSTEEENGWSIEHLGYNNELYVNLDDDEILEAGEYIAVKMEDMDSFETITVNIPNASIVGGGDSGNGGNSGGGGDSGNGGNSGNGGSIISSGLSAFSGITEKLGSLTSEFVPYLIYIAIGILGITLIIAVVKYILGYLKGQAMGSYNGGGRYNREGMKERRTQRRRLRRLKKQAGKFEYRYNNYKKRGIDDKAAKEQANYMVKNRKKIGKRKGYR